MEADATRVLLVEDDEDDYSLTRGLLSDIEGHRFDLHWEPTYEKGLERILTGHDDVILVDFHLGESSGLDLIREALSNGCGTPMILLTGMDTREVDLEAMSAGAVDYLPKARLQPRALERSIRYAIERKRVEGERDEVINKLLEAMSQIKTLSGMLPICAQCKKIRDDQGYWNFLEAYIKDHSDAEFSHGICPECARKLYPKHTQPNLE